MNNFFKLLSTNYKPLLTSLFLALLLWVAVITDKDYSRKLVVPFKISRLAPGYVFLTPPPDEVILEVSGKGRALFGINFYNASIDLELTEINKSTLLNLQEYQQRFSIPRNLGIKIVEIIEPKSIPLKIDRKLEKEISVQVIAAITCTEISFSSFRSILSGMLLGSIISTILMPKFLGILNLCWYS